MAQLNTADVASLKWLAEDIQKCVDQGAGLTLEQAERAMNIIRSSIRGPYGWPTKKAGREEAERMYPGSPSQRLAFNFGVDWTVHRVGTPISWFIYGNSDGSLRDD